MCTLRCAVLWLGCVHEISRKKLTFSVIKNTVFYMFFTFILEISLLIYMDRRLKWIEDISLLFSELFWWQKVTFSNSWHFCDTNRGYTRSCWPLIPPYHGVYSEGKRSLFNFQTSIIFSGFFTLWFRPFYRRATGCGSNRALPASSTSPSARRCSQRTEATLCWWTMTKWRSRLQPERGERHTVRPPFAVLGHFLFCSIYGSLHAHVQNL